MKPVAPWPKSKVREPTGYEHTGLGYFGPFHLKKNKERTGLDLKKNNCILNKTKKGRNSRNACSPALL